MWQHHCGLLTSLLDAELHGAAHCPHWADRLALILALIVGGHSGDAERSRGQNHVAAVQGQWAAPPRPGNDRLRVASGFAGKVHCVTLQDRLVLRCDGEVWDGWEQEGGGVIALSLRKTSFCIGYFSCPVGFL